MKQVKKKNSRIFPKAENEWYVEPPAATLALLSKEAFFGPILDPACGGGNIVKTCREQGLEAFGKDIVFRDAMDEQYFLGEDDFFQANELPCSNIITNPPYFRHKGTEGFIRKALSFPNLQKLAVFSTLGFLASETRALELFNDIPPSRVWIICPRVSAPPGEFLAAGGEQSGDTKDSAWYVWDRTHAHTGTLVGWATHNVKAPPRKIRPMEPEVSRALSLFDQE